MKKLSKSKRRRTACRTDMMSFRRLNTLVDHAEILLLKIVLFIIRVIELVDF